MLSFFKNLYITPFPVIARIFIPSKVSPFDMKTLAPPGDSNMAVFPLFPITTPTSLNRGGVQTDF